MRFTVGSEYDLDMSVKVGAQYIDPLIVRLDLRDPDGIITTHETPDDPAIIRGDVGRYRYVLAPTKPGRWLYKWSTQGGVMMARTRVLYVEDAFATL